MLLKHLRILALLPNSWENVLKLWFDSLYNFQKSNSMLARHLIGSGRNFESALSSVDSGDDRVPFPGLCVACPEIYGLIVGPAEHVILEYEDREFSPFVGFKEKLLVADGDAAVNYSGGGHRSVV